MFIAMNLGQWLQFLKSATWMSSADRRNAYDTCNYARDSGCRDNQHVIVDFKAEVARRIHSSAKHHGYDNDIMSIEERRALVAA